MYSSNEERCKAKIRYLLNVTFYAGSDDAEDIDRGLYLISLDKPVTYEEISEIFRTVNKLLDPYKEETDDFPISYNCGLNIDTLMEGIEIYTKAKVEPLANEYGKVEYIDDVYFLEQWQ